MAAATPKPPQRAAIRLGHVSRLSGGGVEVTLLILGHLVVFLAAMAHDEIVAEMVEAGWFLARFAERYELLIGLCLFLCWSGLTLRLVTVVRRVTARTSSQAADRT